MPFNLTSKMVVHHVNNNAHDLTLSNLWVFKNQSEHSKFHHRIRINKTRSPDKLVPVHVNDCPLELAKSTFIDIKKQYENITCLLTGYGGAGPYPQCFENFNFDSIVSN